MYVRADMHEYQKRATEFVIANHVAALWIDLGLGKTIVSLTAIADLIDSLQIRNALVVAPLRVAQSVWTEEIERWAHVRHLRAAVMVGDRDTRIRALEMPADVHIINVDNVKWLEEHLARAKRKLPWDLIAIDESDMFKDRDTQRFKAMRRMCRQAKRVIELTATPSPNSYLELWPQFYLLDGGRRLGETVTGYRTRYFVELDHEGRKFALKRGADKAIHQRIADITLTLKSEDYLKMPELVKLTHRIDLSDDEMDTYRRLERDAVAKIAGQPIEAISASALAIKLLQLANGQVYGSADDPGDDKARPAYVFHDRKLDRLREIVDTSGGEPVLVSYVFQSDRARILKAFPEAVAIDHDPRTIHRWNRGEIKMLLAHPRSAGHGLNLQHGGRTIVWYGLTWSLGLYKQFIGRLHRQGQAKPVRVHHLIASKTIDEDVMAVLGRKNASQEGLLEAMKRRITSHSVISGNSATASR